ncbi:gamma-butyrobetaine hydroxylase-like domain-containing protein [Sneathiella sp.]|uniref:gamma-butyrobetaine hydroxylase-like domain-containing protein n=1 Tax=Sneathiella sp. TaxID=1964365 RepID=UPI0035631183
MTGEIYDQAGRPKPVEIRLKKDDKKLLVSYDDGHEFQFPAELLRVESPSAEVQGHGASQKQLVAGRRHVGIMELEPVGNYAIRISFDDLHDTGLFSWAYLYELGLKQETIWTSYIENLATQGLSRDP